MLNISLQAEPILKGDYRVLAKAISAVENSHQGYLDFLSNLTINNQIPVIGITGPPGAGKSSLLNALLQILAPTKRIAVLAVDPTSPFTRGSILGDRYRMNDFFLHPNVFIRSLATRGNLGGLSAQTIEITDVLRACPFDLIFIETVGVGQSEIDVARLADITMLVLNPGAGDDIQALKAGILEIADIYVVNKADKPQTEALVQQLHHMLHFRKQDIPAPPILKTIATEFKGTDALAQWLLDYKPVTNNKASLFYEKSLKLIEKQKMKDFNYHLLQQQLEKAMVDPSFNLYTFLTVNYFKS